MKNPFESKQGGMLGERAYRPAPREEWVMHPDLLTPGRLLELAKKRGVQVQRDERGVVMVCAECKGQIVNLDPTPLAGRRRVRDMTDAELHEAQLEEAVWGPSFALDLGQLLADTVRHGVMHHDDALSGALKGQTS